MRALLLLVILGLPSSVLGQKTFGDLDRELGAEGLCADLLKGDFAAASAPIQRKAASRKLTFASVINWLAREVKSPYIEIPGSPLFQELPKDQGNITACRGGGLTLTGNDILKPLYIQYAQARLTVMLRFEDPAAPKLQYIQIGGIEKLSPGQEAPDAFEQRVSSFIKALDATEKSSAEARASTSSR